MNVGQLRELIKNLPDTTPILQVSSDHSYTGVSAEVTTALHGNGFWTEDHGEGVTPEAEYGKRFQILLIQ